MYRLRTRSPILVIALVLGFATTSYAKPSDWADVVESPTPKATSSPKRAATTSTPKKQRVKKKATKRSAAKQKAKARTKGKRR